MDNYQRELMKYVIVRDMNRVMATQSQQNKTIGAVIAMRRDDPLLNSLNSQAKTVDGRIVSWIAGQNQSKYVYVSDDFGEITIKQDDDITITEYPISVSGKTIDALYAIKNGVESPVAKEAGVETEYSVTIDFDDKIDAVKIKFMRDLADDLVIPINYIDADKEAYYERKRLQEEKERMEQEKRRIEALYEKAAIGFSATTGSGGGCLINIFFQPCSDDYSYTEISLYKTYYDVLSSPSLAGGRCFPQEVETFKLTGDEHFLSVSNLTPNGNRFKLKQYGKNGEVLLETDMIPLGS